jgi:hypothetical protein
METLDKKETPIELLGDGLIKGIWQLKFKTVNPNGRSGFSVRLLHSYTDPRTGKNVHLIDMNGKVLPGFMITELVMNFNPSQNKMHERIINFLVGHPKVGIQNEQTKLSGEFVSRKENNPRLTLVNLDYQNTVDLDQEDFIDKLIGKISDDTGRYAFSMEKAQFVLSKLGLEYREERLMNDREKASKKLRSRLKKYVRTSYANAKKVSNILDNIDNAKDEYEIKEMVRLQVLSINNGQYMYHGNPLGISMEAVINYLKNNPEFHIELSESLTARQKSELERYS